MGIESTFSHCATFFRSCSTLHSYIKSGCSTPTRVALAKTGIDLVFARPILRSVAKLSIPGSGLAFKGWTYTITAIIFDPAIEPATDDPNALMCLDTGCEVTLVDKA